MSLTGKATADKVLRGRINRLDTLVVNAYEIAVKNGFKGTEEEWLKSLEVNPERIQQYVNEYMEEHPIATDTTLTISGQAADAKAVGDALKKKVDSTDIVDNLNTSDEKRPLSAKQGVELKKSVDELNESVGELVDFGVELNKKVTIPTFDLTEMGVPDIPFGGEIVVTDIDTKELLDALKVGLVKICMRMYDGGGSVYYGEAIVSGAYSPDGDACSISFSTCGYDTNRTDPVIMWQGVVIVGANYIMAGNRELQKALPEWTGGSY